MAEKETGDWSLDNQTGRTKAAELIAAVRESGNPLPLCSAIRDMIERGHYGPIEVGFIAQIAAATI